MTTDARDRFAAEVAATTDTAAQLMGAGPSDDELTAATAALLDARAALQVLRDRAAPLAAPEFQTGPDAAVGLAFTQALIACLEAGQAVATSGAPLPLAGVLRMTRELERVAAGLRSLLSDRDPAPRPFLRLFDQGDAG